MLTRQFPGLQIVAAIAALMAIAGHFVAAGPALLYGFTTAASGLILGIAFVNWRAQRTAYALWISIGLLFSLAGDLALLQPDRYFLQGLGAFLVTHVAYLVAFTRDVKFPARWVAWIFYLAFVGGIYVFLFGNFPQGLKLPVGCYSALLGSMAGQAMGRSFVLRTKSSRLTAVGGTLFLVSDTLLAYDRFHGPIVLAPVLILVPYYLGQLLMAWSTEEKWEG